MLLLKLLSLFGLFPLVVISVFRLTSVSYLFFKMETNLKHETQLPWKKSDSNSNVRLYLLWKVVQNGK